MNDALPGVQKYWEKFFKVGKELALFYGFETIETPILEHAELFKKGIGLNTDVVGHEMYTLKTKGGDFLALRPELTASVVRAYIENGFANQPQPIKFFHFGPVFRHESSQSGRYRQFHQADFDIIGEVDPVVDAQVIQSVYAVLSELGLKGLSVHINSIGDRSCWNKYRDELKSYYRNKLNHLCKNCKNRYKENPLRMLDCKDEGCAVLKASAPNSVDFLDKSCHDHFKLVLEFLDELNIPYVLDPYLVRGLDYYTRTVFEIMPEDASGSQITLASGGRYDYLVAQLGGKPAPAVGGSIGIERAVNEMRRQDVKVNAVKPRTRIFLAQIGDLAKKKSLKLFEEFRKNNIGASESFGRDSIKAQLRVADRLGAELALIIGQKEALDNTVILREMQSGTQEIIPIAKIIDAVKKRLKKSYSRPFDR
ncbi:MAG: Histidine-tRNA ligase [Candidatus Azambacteria bacterium GW2011_GWE1_42_9]|nr:MAG: Histidine-tRNA ligase [Candidatus Azambacteria bacterium GW2011_GWF1_41_10]KKS49360.1 MAG: Histidine-tRNA ligase [Candidatus Azambacteria bacterium GW2011_GWF2_42_22]KKS79607.1 MAG: Histidine-tRNA ligase [Candidatus Azambacteria bacterium GW2011_GWE1_42_9]KKT03471.1 MAG: Histidine-tRNA ligase [Candidatus Azambacteria bacterium GW2011_GWD1_43_18]KKT12499.1 MAG: Histidine-tRNA ligase [Candidatus Azambacteria bacterium GW2011_GWC2_43_27]KKT16490.1 MAG: histidyl-tRNA synthetase, histidyl-t